MTPVHYSKDEDTDPMISRRRFLATAATGALVLAMGPMAAFAATGSVAVDDLMEPGPLPEMTLGNPEAEVTVVEYASMTCGHCATFHMSGFQTLKTEYIDTGKVYFVMREFPLDPLAAAGFMLARRAPGDRYFEVVDLLFERQRDWAYSDNPVVALETLAKQFGYSPQTFRDTLSDQELLDAINAIRQRGGEEFGVDSTPTFFINGERVKGAMSPEDVKAKIDPLLTG
jgi:protein-disulfide isomerase